MTCLFQISIDTKHTASEPQGLARPVTGAHPYIIFYLIHTHVVFGSGGVCLDGVSTLSPVLQMHHVDPLYMFYYTHTHTHPRRHAGTHAHVCVHVRAHTPHAHAHTNTHRHMPLATAALLTRAAASLTAGPVTQYHGTSRGRHGTSAQRGRPSTTWPRRQELHRTQSTTSIHNPAQTPGVRPHPFHHFYSQPGPDARCYTTPKIPPHHIP